MQEIDIDRVTRIAATKFSADPSLAGICEVDDIVQYATIEIITTQCRYDHAVARAIRSCRFDGMTGRKTGEGPRQRDRQNQAPNVEALRPPVPGSPQDPDLPVDMRDAIEAIENPESRKILGYLLAGFSGTEIAEMLGVAEPKAWAAIKKAKNSFKKVW